MIQHRLGTEIFIRYGTGGTSLCHYIQECQLIPLVGIKIGMDAAREHPVENSMNRIQQFMVTVNVKPDKIFPEKWLIYPVEIADKGIQFCTVMINNSNMGRGALEVRVQFFPGRSLGLSGSTMWYSMPGSIYIYM